MSSKMVFIYYGRMTDCRWVSYSLLTYDPQRLKPVTLVRSQPGETWWAKCGGVDKCCCVMWA